MKRKLITICLTISMLFACLTGSKAQQRAIVRATPAPQEIYDMLNGSGKKEAIRIKLAETSFDVAAAAATRIPESVGAKNTLGLLYDVPNRVAMDRYLLTRAINDRMSELLELIFYWESMSPARKKEAALNIGSRFTAEERNRILSSREMPESVVRDVVRVHRESLSGFQAIIDNLSGACSPVEFKSYNTRVTADIRPYSPVPGKAGALGFMRANGSGRANLSEVFNNISYNDIYNNPAAGSLLIYRK